MTDQLFHGKYWNGHEGLLLPVSVVGLAEDCWPSTLPALGRIVAPGLATSLHLMPTPFNILEPLVAWLCPSQGPSWERRPIMGALKSPPCWRSLGLGGQACTYPWRYSPFPAACHSWGEAGPRSWRALQVSTLPAMSQLFISGQTQYTGSTPPGVLRNEKIWQLQLLALARSWNLFKWKMGFKLNRVQLCWFALLNPCQLLNRPASNADFWILFRSLRPLSWTANITLDRNYHWN